MEVKILHNGIEIENINLNTEQEYIIGRDNSCEIQTLDPKVSRRHAKLSYDGQWNVELLSQTGSMTINGKNESAAIIGNQDQLQIHSYTIVFIEAMNDSHMEESSAQEASDNTSVGIEMQQEETSEYIDETTAGGNQTIENYIRITYNNSGEDLLKIEGNHWVLGRSETCDIQVKDGKASRKHIVIRFDGKNYYGKDLGSSNGTSLNEEVMTPDKEYKIKSGDFFQIGAAKIYFEQRNPLFDKQLAQLPVQVHQHAMIQMGDQSLNPIDNMPMVTGDKAGEMGFVIPEGMAGFNKKKKNPLFYGAIGILAIALIVGLMGEEKGSKKNASKKPEIKTPYQALSAEQQAFVDRAYASAHRFFSLEQWDLAISELDKVHQHLPKGYVDPTKPEILPSKEMQTIAESAAATLREQQVLEEEQKQQAAFAAKIRDVLNQCQTKAPRMNESQARSCLEFVFINQPDNPQALAIIASIQQREVQRKQRAVAAASRQSQIKRGEALYFSAVAIEKRGDILDAIAAYSKHINSRFEDPKGYKTKSANKRKRLKQKISGEVERLRRKMQNHFEAGGQLKSCIETADKILKLDPNNLDAQDMRALAVTQLNSQLREDYQDSIFKEAHGEIEQAKKIWRRILSRDIKNGDYYNKAVLKLKKHGGS